MGFFKTIGYLTKILGWFCENVFKISCIVSHLYYNNVSCILDVCLLCCNDCVLLGLDWADPMMYLNLHVTCSCIFMHTYLQVLIFLYILLLVLFWFPLSRLVASWHLNKNPLRPRTLFMLGHHILLLTLLFLMFGSVMIKPEKTFWRTFLDNAFIRNAKSSYWIFLILTFPLSSTVEVGIHCITSLSLVPPWSYKSFTPLCTDLIIQYLILLLAFEVRAL